MIHQNELPVYIEDSLPELSGKLTKENCRHVYDVVKQLFQHTVKQVTKHNMVGAKQCMSLAEQLYNKGNAIVKMAIENVFVYSFSHAFFSDEQKRKELMDIVPGSLYDLYKKQVTYSHL